jgi:hypothetical protein
MGGSALLIYGTPSADLLTPRPAPRSLVDRVRGRHPVSGPTETPMGQDRVLLEIACEPLRPLADEFRAFVNAAFEQPWAATQNVREYLGLDVISSYLRGDRIGQQPAEWYFQLTFSACAGMADSSADVAAHWADIWYRRSSSHLADKYFLPFGFTPGRVDLTGHDNLFVPLGAGGYAEFRRGDEAGFDGPNQSRFFSLDASVLEPLEGEDLTAEWRELDDALRDVRAVGACRCQLCAPSLDLARFDSLAIVNRLS